MAAGHADGLRCVKVWARVRQYFEDDDGSLPDIYFEGLSGKERALLYPWLMRRAETVGSPTAWSTLEGRDVPLSQFANPARAVGEGLIESFRHGLGNLVVDGVEIEGISVFCGKDELSLDYRMGPHWNQQIVEALFELLCQVRQVAPSVRIVQAWEGLWEKPNGEVTDALDAFAAARNA